MNQHSGELRSLILAASQRPYGLATEQIPGYTTSQVGRMVQKLQAAGLLFRAKVGGKYGRYFDTEGRANDYAREHHAKPAPVKTQAVRVPSGPAITPPGVEVQRCPDNWTKEPAKVLGVFSALRPGQYIAPAPAWLERMA